MKNFTNLLEHGPVLTYRDEYNDETVLLDLFYTGTDIPNEFKKYLLHLDLFRNWVLNFLSKPNQQLGREGPVCPFTRTSYKSHHFWVNVQQSYGDSIDIMRETIYKFRDIFLSIEPKEGPEKLLKTIVILFPTMPKELCKPLIDGCQSLLKDEFVKEGLMIGQFHPNNDQGGLHNKDFKSLRAPIPLLAIRNMVKTDSPFLFGNPEHEYHYYKQFPKN